MMNPQIVSPPAATKCISCSSENIEDYYDMTVADLDISVFTLFVITTETRHYLCKDYKCVWKD